MTAGLSPRGKQGWQGTGICRHQNIAASLKLDITCRTYHTLISPGKGKSRLEQVIEWVGGPDFDGAIVFDEAHKVCLSADTDIGPAGSAYHTCCGIAQSPS